ncbi:hypothetical protein EW026_g5600 [Hermanssonia centrifuga]|uniref:XPG-I domain-containing protein n=1 Tax=Hermanssonia centrifuga TaxID=98765 RepID=A0A4S4KDL0_9APHY|nr:hypothetical protein EW026_g5600 [Hermanssonia centrifuga]
MGVAGLWDVLRPAGVPRSLTHMAVVDGFEANPAGMRGLRIGIDASIWIVHSANGKEGENPELRTILFKCTKLMRKPFLPLFVFDGPYRPDVKRGKHINKAAHWMVAGMQAIFTALGIEWRTAPGEAEAELAYLNRIGVIDVVLTDDVDTFLFGATKLMRNCNNTLSGNQSFPVLNELGKDDGNHTMTYSSADIEHKLGLKQGGLILIALLSGGDYHDGVRGCGPAVGLGLAKCGFGDSLLDAARTLGERDLNTFLHGWRQEICLELRTNPRKLLPTKKVALANSFPADFPDLRILDMYVNPRTSETVGKTAADMRLNWDKEPDIGLIAGLCEQYFEWGYREMIIKRFRTIIWPYAVLRIIRRAAILADRKQARSSDTILPSTPRKKGRERTFSVGTPSKMIKHHFSTSSQASRAYDSDSDSDDSDEQLISKIHLSRRHVETDKILEYRLEIAPKQLVRLADAGIEGRRQPLDMTGLSDWEGDEDDEEEEEGRKKSKSKTTKPPPPPDSRLRLWLPASMVAIVEPELVADFKEKEAKKESKKAGKTSSSAGTSKAKASGTTAAKTSKAKTAKTKIAAIPEEDCDEEHVPRESAAKVTITVLQQEPAPSKEKIVASTSKNFAAGRDADPKAMDQFFKTSKGIRNAKKSSSIAKGKGQTVLVSLITLTLGTLYLRKRHQA